MRKIILSLFLVLVLISTAFALNSGGSGIIISDSEANKPTGLAEGAVVYTQDTNKLYIWKGAAYKELTITAIATAYTQTYSTASRTNPNATAATLTDNSGGTANTTLESIGTTYSQSAVRNNFADLAAMENKNTADVLALKKLVNGLIDDLQTQGIIQ